MFNIYKIFITFYFFQIPLQASQNQYHATEESIFVITPQFINNFINKDQESFIPPTLIEIICQYFSMMNITHCITIMEWDLKDKFLDYSSTITPALYKTYYLCIENTLPINFSKEIHIAHNAQNYAEFLSLYNVENQYKNKVETIVEKIKKNTENKNIFDNLCSLHHKPSYSRIILVVNYNLIIIESNFLFIGDGFEKSDGKKMLIFIHYSDAGKIYITQFVCLSNATFFIDEIVFNKDEILLIESNSYHKSYHRGKIPEFTNENQQATVLHDCNLMLSYFYRNIHQKNPNYSTDIFPKLNDKYRNIIANNLKFIHEIVTQPQQNSKKEIHTVFVVIGFIFIYSIIWALRARILIKKSIKITKNILKYHS